MPSSSNTKWTVNCSMMSRLLTLLLALCLLVVPVSAAQGAESLSGSADILLLHEENISDDALEQLRILADGATAIGRSLELGTKDQARRHLSGYQLILCYDLDRDDVFSRFLLRSGAKVLVLGGHILPGCLETGAPARTQREKSGVLRFDFSGQTAYQAIVSLPETVYEWSGDYASGTLEAEGRTVPFCTGTDSLRYMPMTQFPDKLARAALLWELSNWLWEYDGLPPQRGQYWVLEDVYAYIPAQTLLDRVQLLIDAKIPFVISVNPTFQNGDYPAMQQFCQVLRYAQANGGAVILRTPILRTPVSDWAQFGAVMTDAVTALTDQGVYPLGFDVPYSWLWDREALNWMKRSRTVFLHEDSTQPDFTRDTTQNIAYYNYNTLVFPALTLDEKGENSVLQFRAAQRMPASVSVEDLRASLEALQKNRNPYYSLWDSEQSVWADNLHLSYQNGAVTLNGELCSLEYAPEGYPENYDYQRNILKRFTVSIQNESRFLITLVTVVTVLFLGMILYARGQQRNHFLMAEPSEKGGAHIRGKRKKEEKRHESD